MALMYQYISGWQALPTYQATPHTFSHLSTSVALIIPARNEEENIGRCLQAIAKQTFSSHLLEVIVINDHSTDNTANIVQQWQQQLPNLKLINLQEVLPPNTTLNAYKKKALEIAINNTKQTLIVTTDADCMMPPNWLATLVQFYETEPCALIAAPVCFFNETTFLQRFQAYDFVGMQVITGASVHKKMSNMCNGANLAYTRQAFKQVQGFAGIDNIASGDDLLLMHKIEQAYPNGIRFLKNQAAIVYTLPQKNLQGFVNQRLRWASKSAKYQDFRITALLAGVYFFNVSIVINALAALLGYSATAYLFVFQLITKSIFDGYFLYIGCRFFKRKDLMFLFFPAQFCHILYIIIIGTLGNFGSYTWKGRTVK